MLDESHKESQRSDERQYNCHCCLEQSRNAATIAKGAKGNLCFAYGTIENQMFAVWDKVFVRCDSKRGVLSLGLAIGLRKFGEDGYVTVLWGI